MWKIGKYMSENVSLISNSINNTYKDVFSVVYVHSIFKTATALTCVHTNEASHGSEHYIL